MLPLCQYGPVEALKSIKMKPQPRKKDSRKSRENSNSFCKIKVLRDQEIGEINRDLIARTMKT